MEGREIVKLANQFKGGGYELGALPFRINANYLTEFRDGKDPFDPKRIKGKTDCAEFVTTVLFGKTKKLYGANNNEEKELKKVDAWTNFFKRDYDNSLFDKITPSEAAKIPGAIVLRYTKNSRIGHIVISEGTGTTIEAHSGKLGITNALLSGRTWDAAFLIPGFNYTTNSGIIIHEPKVTIYRLKTPYMRDKEVSNGPIWKIQTVLNEKGYDTKGIEGVYGPGTFQAVTQYQKINELLVDGMVGPETAKSLGVNIY